MSDHDPKDDDEVGGLGARERGQPGPTVSDATAAEYARLQSLIADLPAAPGGATLDKDWQQGVFAAIDAAEAKAEAKPGGPSQSTPVPSAASATPERTRSRSRRWMASAAVFAMAAVVTVTLVVYRYSGRGVRPATEPLLAFEVEPANRPHRGHDPSIGDKLVVRGELAGAGELRVYDDTGAELVRCTVPTPDCSVERSGNRTTLQLTMVLRAPGALRAILFSAPLGGPPGSINDDSEAATRAGIAFTHHDLVEVH